MAATECHKTLFMGLQSSTLTRGETTRAHVHEVHQLAWLSDGALRVDAAQRTWVLPPTLALWIPAGTAHTTVALRTTRMLGIYLDPSECPESWDDITVVSVSPLARHLIEYLAEDPTPDLRWSAEQVLLDVLRPLTAVALELPLPTDPRAADVAALLLQDPTDARSLAEFARAVGSSTRTLLRLFVAETGMTFTQWRTHARLQAAITLLLEGEQIGRIAALVGYDTTSSFTSAFRRILGVTPRSYAAQVMTLGGIPVADRARRARRASAR